MRLDHSTPGHLNAAVRASYSILEAIVNRNKHQGAVAELTASSWLMGQGYDVFRNVSQHGLADLVAVNFRTGERLLIDVKTVTTLVLPSGKLSKSTGKLSTAQAAAGVTRLLVDGTECIFA